MPRFGLTAKQKAILLRVAGEAIDDHGPAFVVSLILMTGPELKAELGPRITALRTRNQSDLASADQQAADHKTQLAADNADLDDFDAAL